MINIVVDAMGGDNAPNAIVEGSLRAVEDFDIKITLVGAEDKIKECLGDYSDDRISIVNATEVIDCDDDPAVSIRRKSDSSIVVGMKLVAEGKGDAFVSAGSTGAVVSGATLIIKRIKGIRRVAIGTVFPSNGTPTLVVDCGANADCTPDFLQQFAIMGDAYMRAVHNMKKPKVALLNNGMEETKGSELYKSTYQLLKETPVNFVGNIEAREVLMGRADVVVADGFAGNVFLKTTEGTASYITGIMKDMFKKNIISMICALIMKKGIADMKKRLDYTEHGGAPILGANSVVIKAHGSSNAKAFYNAIRQAKLFAENKVVEVIVNNL